MKKDRVKGIVIKVAIGFFLVIAFLTFFSKTINNMLLPKVNVVEVEVGTLDEEITASDMKTHFLLPISTVEVMGETGTVYILNKDENENTVVKEVSVNICKSDELYYEVTSDDSLQGDSQVVYKTSKDIEDGSQVYVEEEAQ